MRKIQMERKLFELLGLKFFVFEHFQDSDLNIDDKSIYPFDDEVELVNIFAKCEFFNIWKEEKRLNSGLICACEGNLNLIVSLLQKIGIKEDAYSVSRSNPNVLYLASAKDMSIFIQKISTADKPETLMPMNIFSNKDNIIYP